MFKDVLVVIISLSSSFAFAAELTEGIYRGTSTRESKSTLASPFSSKDRLTLMVKKAPGKDDSFNAILAQYGYNPVYKPDELAVAVPRMYALRIEKMIEGVFTVKRLMVDTDGEIIVNEDIDADILRITQDLSGEYPKDVLKLTLAAHLEDQVVEETITFDLNPHSTWEPYLASVWIVGGDRTFMGKTLPDVIDYFDNDDLESRISLITHTREEDSLVADATLITNEATGNFKLIESKNAPGMFVFRAADAQAVGEDAVAYHIGAFIDIVNWKSKARPKTTDELLLFNPEEPEQKVLIFYEKEQDEVQVHVDKK